jgi:hypothetical protein
VRCAKHAQMVWVKLKGQNRQNLLSLLFVHLRMWRQQKQKQKLK